MNGKVMASSKGQRKQFLVSLKMKHLQSLDGHIYLSRAKLRHIYKVLRNVLSGGKGKETEPSACTD